ncbi:PAS domain S-box-containing protein [Streptacidiphilus sp. MAP12-16]|uniref:SpoIIE family protein phosphatase n=1 Tax=Streptacidiphilus sp. MAP12-16 TaxID=3156300 RepID=UPI003512CEA1
MANQDGADALFDAAAAALASADTGLMLRRLVGDTAAGVAILDPQLRYRYVNPALARMIDMPAADLLGRTTAEVLPDIENRPDVLRQVLRDGKPREATTSGRTRADAPDERRWWHGTYHRLEIDGRAVGIVGIVLEVTDSRQQQHDLEHARARLALLADAASRIGTTLDIERTCAELANFVVPPLGDLATVEVLPIDEAEAITKAGPLRLHRTALACVPELRSRLGALEPAGEYVRYQPGSTVARCLETREPILRQLPAGDEADPSAPDSVQDAALRAMGIHSTLVVPLAARGQVIGVVSLARARDAPRFTGDEATIAHELAGRAAISIDNARRYARSQGVALELQRALLAEPGNPHPNIELASRYLPSGTSAVVGGDWYETVRLAYGRTLLVMGDVMGHGVEAAVDMSNYRSMLRYVASTDLPPHRILRQLDALISQSDSGRPATCMLALADPARGRCTFSSAGHLPPALFAADSATELLEVPTGPPLGTGVGGYESVSADFRPGQVLLLYTDGLVERRGEDIDVSLARLAELRLPVTGDLDALLDTVLRRLVPQAAEDDVALLAARLRPRLASEDLPLPGAEADEEIEPEPGVHPDPSRSS